jgi:hypothetical protein
MYSLFIIMPTTGISQYAFYRSIRLFNRDPCFFLLLFYAVPASKRSVQAASVKFWKSVVEIN